MWPLDCCSIELFCCCLQKENTVVFAGGQLRPGVEKEQPNKNKKWAIPGYAQGNSAFIPEK